MKFLNPKIYLLFFFKATLMLAQDINYSNITQSDTLIQNHHLNSYKNYTVSNGLLSNTITGITQDQLGYLWFSSNKGITRFDGNDFKNFSRKDGLETNFVTTVFSHKDSLLIGSPNALLIKRNQNFLSYECKKVNCISVIKRVVVIGTDKGIYRVGDGFLAPLRTNYQIDLNTVNDVQFDGTSYWVATENALWKIDNLLNAKSIERIDTLHYTSILIDKNQVIASTLNNGIKIIQGKKITTIPLTTSSIKGIRKVRDQYWVFSTNEGIEIVNQNFSFNRKMNKYNSLKTNAISDVFEDKQQNIWIATINNGVYKFENNTKQTLATPRISFENIEVLYKTIDSINFNSYKGILKLPSNKNHLAFSFKSVDINNPKKILYRYKLNGDYSPWSNKSSVNLANLQAGKYTFSVQSKIANENESKPIQFQFYIDKPLYKKAWFQWTSLGFLVTLISLWVFLYIKKIRAKNESRIKQLQLENYLLSLEQKALQLQMNPHFIFNVLNGIKAQGNSGKLDELNTTINKFSSLLRSILNTSRKEEISLSEEISTLENYISLEQQMSSLPFTYSIISKLTLDTEEILIPPMLIQPFIENSIKHGIKNKENGEISIIFYNIHNFLHCEIIDNGIGINQSKKEKKVKTHASLAIEVTKDRIMSLAPEASINFIEIKENNMVKGTKVWFKIPLKTDF